ncbi:hypothetical protein A2803_01240 [Candidatus Woesebacteria bacterium RIFCSPHIGHO2_01_FULL_44_21]|uniref:Uncharacterized protein n=1 Tax=Candidatus Woesebacteria bacterium RIFCSPHIGHO2_01_FULL_44_21 TaxID=1802503 RepID=A0A1F7YZ84_9BACT|nr:MAG: hypothetical protein A2803_01240 [Candidatus Woesebacteria bacterium RIFCSPHIGHO2_01_FULL_44_21]OGM70816.1 MAG: hypothetical protein A2897_05230 [Candidatus Woesebacteria bacterium RIFCSPLOWO2_01_FULL_44_24b]
MEGVIGKIIPAIAREQMDRQLSAGTKAARGLGRLVNVALPALIADRPARHPIQAARIIVPAVP